MKSKFAIGGKWTIELIAVDVVAEEPSGPIEAHRRVATCIAGPQVQSDAGHPWQIDDDWVITLKELGSRDFALRVNIESVVDEHLFRWPDMAHLGLA